MLEKKELFFKKAIQMFRNRHLSFALRIIAGGTFIFSGVSKLLAESAFADEVAEYKLLPDYWLQLFSSALPWVEVIVGVLLVIGLITRVASAIGTLSALSFMIANSVVLYRGYQIDCPCFGENAALPTEIALGIDFILFIMCLQILLRKGDFLNLGSRLFKNTKWMAKIG